MKAENNHENDILYYCCFCVKVLPLNKTIYLYCLKQKSIHKGEVFYVPNVYFLFRQEKTLMSWLNQVFRYLFLYFMDSLT